MINPISHSGSNPDDSSLLESWSYEETVAQVETMIEQIESGELPLAEVFAQFTEAMKYLRQCEAFLNQRQQQMDLLIETLASEPEF